MSSYNGTTVSADTMILEVTGVDVSPCDGGGGVGIKCHNSPLSDAETGTLQRHLSWTANTRLDRTRKSSGEAADIVRGWLRPGSAGVSNSPRDSELRDIDGVCRLDQYGVHKWVPWGATEVPTDAGTKTGGVAAGVSGDAGQA